MTVDAAPEMSGRRSYLPGAWFGVFGAHATVLLPPSEKRRVAALWELLDDGADFDEVLDALIATGLRDLPGFVLVSDTDVEGAVTARVVVRGDARVSFETTEGPVEVVAAGAGTWVERTVPGVTSAVLDVSSPDDDAATAVEPMTVTSGLVRVSRVQTPPGGAGGVDTDPMDLPPEDSDEATGHDGGGLAAGALAGSALGAAGVAAAHHDEADDEVHDEVHDEVRRDPEPLVDEPALPPEPDPAPGPLAEGDPALDPATDALDTPVDPAHDAPAGVSDPLDPSVPVEHHGEPAAQEVTPLDEPVGEPTEMMSFDDLAAESEPAAGDPAGPADPSWGAPAAQGGWAPADAPQDGPPAAPDFGSGAAPAGPQWAPPPAPSNPFAPSPAGQDGAPADDHAEQGWEQQGYEQQQGYDQQPGYDQQGYQQPGFDQQANQGGWGSQADQADQGWGEPAAAPAPGWGEAPPSGQADVDHDGETRAGDYDPELYARSQPGIPGQPPAPSVTARPVARLMMSHGETVDVDRAILVGRAPEARRFTATEQPRLVTVPSPNQEISSTHLEVRPGSGADHGTAVVTDMGSTNGTVLIQPGLAPEDLQPGVTVQLIPGAVIDLGDGLTIQVANP